MMVTHLRSVPQVCHLTTDAKPFILKVPTEAFDHRGGTRKRRPTRIPTEAELNDPNAKLHSTTRQSPPLYCGILLLWRSREASPFTQTQLRESGRTPPRMYGSHRSAVREGSAGTLGGWPLAGQHAAAEETAGASIRDQAGCVRKHDGSGGRDAEDLG